MAPPPFPNSVFAPNGSLIICNEIPGINPCLGYGDFACFESSSNCFGAVMNITDLAIAIIPGQLCTIDICPLGTFNQAYLDYRPTVPGNSIFASAFFIFLILQTILAFQWRTWDFSVGVLGGLVLEVVGYIGRTLIYNQPFAKTPFLIYLICLTIAPAFLSASIYLCLSRIIVAYGTQLSYSQPRFYSITFITCDTISLVLQAIGGALASTANTQTDLDKGTNVMLAGLAWQVVSLVLFMALCTDFAFRVRRSSADRNPVFQSVVSRSHFKLFLWALGLATLAIFIRSVFRVAELSRGFRGPLDNQEVTFMVLEGVMIIMASTLLTAFHPGRAFEGMWKIARTFKAGKTEVDG